MVDPQVPKLPVVLIKGDSTWLITSNTEYWSAIFDGYSLTGVTTVDRSKICATLADLDELRAYVDSLFAGGTPTGGGVDDVIIAEDLSDPGTYTFTPNSSFYEDPADPGTYYLNPSSVKMREDFADPGTYLLAGATSSDADVIIVEDINDPGTYTFTSNSSFYEDSADPGTYYLNPLSAKMSEDPADPGTYLIGA